MDGNPIPIIVSVIIFFLGVLNNRNESRKQQLRAAALDMECWQQVNNLLARNDDLQRQLDAARSGGQAPPIQP